MNPAGRAAKLSCFSSDFNNLAGFLFSCKKRWFCQIYQFSLTFQKWYKNQKTAPRLKKPEINTKECIRFVTKTTSVREIPEHVVFRVFSRFCMFLNENQKKKAGGGQGPQTPQLAQDLGYRRASGDHPGAPQPTSYARPSLSKITSRLVWGVIISMSKMRTKSSDYEYLLFNSEY